jgi:hypothetical protein
LPDPEFTQRDLDALLSQRWRPKAIDVKAVAVTITLVDGREFLAQAEDWGWMEEGVFATGAWADEPTPDPLRDLLIPYAQVRHYELHFPEEAS